MSDREDFEEISAVKDADDNSVGETEIYSTKRKITHIIRQNPLVHLGEKSEKPTFFEKIKRAFSTEDTYSGGFIDDEPENGGLLGDSEDVFGNFISKLKSSKSAKDKNDNLQTDAHISESKNDSYVGEEPDGNLNNEFDNSFESEEEFEMISSFLDDRDIEKEEDKYKENHSENDEKINDEEADDAVIVDTSDNSEFSEPNEESADENSDDIVTKLDESVKEDDSTVSEDISSDEEAESKAEPSVFEFEVEDEDESTETTAYTDTENTEITNVTEESEEQAVKETAKSDKVMEKAAALTNKIKNDFSRVGGKIKLSLSGAKNKIFEMWNSREEKPEPKDSEMPEQTADEENNGGDVLYAEIFGEDDEPIPSVTEIISKSDNVIEETEKHEEKKTENEKEPEQNPVQMTVIKNETYATKEIDISEVRKNLNVISSESEKDKSEDDDFEILLEEPSILNETPEEKEERLADILTEDEKSAEAEPKKAESELFEDFLSEEEKQIEANRKVLDKVKEYEDKAKSLPKNPQHSEKFAKAYEKEFGEVKHIENIEITDYMKPGQAEEIKVKTGKFSESVRAEYEFYIGYRRLQNVAKSQSKAAKPIEEEKISDSVDFENIASEVKNKDTDNKKDTNTEGRSEKHNRVEYRSEEDKERIKKYILNDCKKSKTRFTLSLLLTAVMFLLFCFNGKFAATTAEMAAGETGAERVFALLNLLIFGAGLFVCRDILKDGIKPLKKLKVTADTSVSAACTVTLLQSLLVLIAPSFFFSQSLNVYSLLAMFALTLNSLGRHMTAKRAKGNFSFVISSFNKYTARFYHDPRMTAKILSNTSIKSSKIVFQKRTSFLKNFIKLTYAEDEGTGMSEKFTIPSAVVCLVVSVLYFVLSKSFMGALSVLSVMLCMAVPMCGRLLGALPLYQLSKNSLRNQAMVVGYPAVEHFSDSCAIMIDAKELYPEGSVHMNGIKTFSGRKIDDALFAAAAVMVNAGGAMAGMFDGIIQGNKEEVLPPVESLVYEDEKGLIGWVNNERVLVGNRFLLEKHGIEPPSIDYERKYRKGGNEILYLASSGELVAMFIIEYSANRRVMDALRRMESNGMSLLVRTVDVNITPERISKDFGIYHETVKVLPTALGNIIRDEMIGKEKSEPALIATKGGVVPLGRAVSGCIKAKKNISLSLAIQAIEILLGLLLVTTIVLFAGIQQLGAIEMFIFCLFWSVAVVIAPFIQKSYS